jgi:hypothetical protein
MDKRSLQRVFRVSSLVAVAAILLALSPEIVTAEPAKGAPFPETTTTPSPPPSPPLGLAVRLSLRLSGFSNAGYGVSASRRAGPVGVEASAGPEDFGQTYQGFGGEILGRVFVGDGMHVLSFGLGPSLRHADTFRSIGFLASELAYEIRPRGGVSLLIAIGEEFVLNDSGMASCMADGFAGCIFWRSHYNAGDMLARFRLGLGVSF